MKINCFNCSKLHHVALYDSEKNIHSSNNSSSVTNIARMDDKTNVLIQTAKVKVKTVKTVFFYLFLSAVLRCHISLQLWNHLQFKTVGSWIIPFQTFGKNCWENILEKVNWRIFVLDGLEDYVTCFVKENCALMNNQNKEKKDQKRKIFVALQILLLPTVMTIMKAYQLIYLLGRTNTGQLLIT